MAVVLGAPVLNRLSNGGFVDSGSSSARAEAILSHEYGGSAPDIIVVVRARDGARSKPAIAAGHSVVRTLRRDPAVAAVGSFWSAGADAGALLSRDGDDALVTATIGPGANDRGAVAQRVQARLESMSRQPRVQVQVFSGALADAEVTEQSRQDSEKAEIVTFPVIALALLLVFGSFAAALIPLVNGVLAVAGTLAILRLFAAFTSVSVFALNLTTGLGLALAIDYSLLIVTRYREERRRGAGDGEALSRTMATAGRTVMFSACLVMLSLASLVVFPLDFLRSFAYAGTAVVAFDAMCAVIVTPALLAVLGRRVGQRARDARELDTTLWYRSSAFAMRHAVVVLVVGVVVLVGAAWPFAGVKWGPSDYRLLPADSTARVVGEQLRTEFPALNSRLVTVVVPDRDQVSDEALGRYAAALSRVPDVTSATAVTGRYVDGRRSAPPPSGMASGSSTYLTVEGSADPLSPAATDILSAVKAVPAPAETLVTGPVARQADELLAVTDRLPLALLLIAASTLVVVFMLTGSLVLPVKAVLMSALSLTATFGALVWVFQDGHLLGLISDTPASGFLVATIPLLMFCMAFGMSMDYEVFLLARICEERARCGPGREAGNLAVRRGMAASGRIVSAAAMLMGVVFAGLLTSSLSVVQMFGLGLVLFVVLDATVIRGLLLPAFMQLAGSANWWAPGPLRRWHDRHGWRDSD